MNAIFNIDETFKSSKKYVGDNISKWLELIREDKTVFSDTIVNDFTNQLPSAIISSCTVNEDTAGFCLSYIVGLNCCNNADSETIYHLMMHMFYSYDGRGFIHSFTPSEEVLNELVNKTDFSVQRLLKRSRLVTDDEDIEEYMRYYQDLPKEKLLAEVNQDSFYLDFRPLPDDCIMLLCYLVKCGMYQNLVDIMLSMKIPFLQVELLSIINEPDVLLSLYRALCDREDIDTSVLKVMLMNKWMNCVVNVQEIYIKSLPIDAYDEEVMEAYMFHHKNSSIEIKNWIKTGAQLFIDKDGIKEVSEWLFRKSMKQHDINEHNMAYNEVLDPLQEYVNGKADIESLNAYARDIHYLSFVAKQFINKEVGEKQSVALWDNICDVIRSKDFYWPGTLENKYLREMRAFAKFISAHLSVNFITAILSDFKVRYEGINADYMKDWNYKANRESYIFCVLLFVLEVDEIDVSEKCKFFKLISGALLEQARYCGMDFLVESSYQIALIVAEVIAEQVLTECKDEYESQLAEYVDDKTVVMRVLSFAKQPISSNAIDLLNHFKECDWPVIREDYLHRKMIIKMQQIDGLFARLLK
jgi:hypothetical protein